MPLLEIAMAFFTVKMKANIAINTNMLEHLDNIKTLIKFDLINGPYLTGSFLTWIAEKQYHNAVTWLPDDLDIVCRSLTQLNYIKTILDPLASNVIYLNWLGSHSTYWIINGFKIQAFVHDVTAADRLKFADITATSIASDGYNLLYGQLAVLHIQQKKLAYINHPVVLGNILNRYFKYIDRGYTDHSKTSIIMLVNLIENHLLTSDNKTIAVTGHTSGLGLAIFNYFNFKSNYKVIGMSRSNGFDLTKNIDHIVDTVIDNNCDYFFNNAYVDDIQATLIEKLAPYTCVITSGSMAADTSLAAQEANTYYKNKSIIDKAHRRIKKNNPLPMLLLKMGYLENYPDKEPISYSTVLNAIDFWINNPRVSIIEMDNLNYAKNFPNVQWNV